MHIKNTLSIAAIALGSLALSAPAHALSWNWSYTNSLGDHAVGTFTTDGISSNNTNIYTISAITGTYTPLDDLPQTITGLSNFMGSSQTIMWGGTISLPILVNYKGFAYATGSNDYNIYSNNGGSSGSQRPYHAADQIYTGNGITTSSLTPQKSQNAPFEFSPEQGFMLGIPLFIGLRYLKKKRA